MLDRSLAPDEVFPHFWAQPVEKLIQKPEKKAIDVKR